MPTSGERLAAVEAILQRMETYEHQRWHKLANDLQPIYDLPRQVAKELGILEGKFNGIVEKAVITAVQPLIDDVARLEREVEALKTAHNQSLGAQTLGKAILQSPILGGFIGAMIAFGIVILSYFRSAGK